MTFATHTLHLALAPVAALALFACATPPRPATLEQAREAIHGPQANEHELFQPRLIAEAREHLVAGEAAYQDRRLLTAELHGLMATQRLRTAEHIIARDAARALSESLSPDATDTLASPPEAQGLSLALSWDPPTSDTEIQQKTERASAKQRGPTGDLAAMARDSVFKAKMARAEALGLRVDARCPNTFREYSALVDLAQEQLDVGAYALAFEVTIRASERFNACLRDDPDAATGVAPVAATKAPVASPRAAAASDTPSPESLVRSAEALQAQVKARADLAADPRVAEADTFTTAAKATLAEGDGLSAAPLAKQAIQRYETLLRETSSAGKQASSGDCTAAKGAVQRAQKQLDALRPDQLTEAQRQRRERATEALRKATAAQTSGQCDRAQLLAEDVTAIVTDLAAARAAAGSPSAPAKTAATTAAAPTSDGRSTSGNKNEALRRITTAREASGRAMGHANAQAYMTGSGLLKQSLAEFDRGAYDTAATLATQATFAFESLSDGPASAGSLDLDPSWRPAYGQVVDALALRDRALNLAQDADKGELELGDQLIESSRRAWHQGQYAASGRYAQEAALSYQKIVSRAESRMSAAERAQLEAERAAEAQRLALDAEEEARAAAALEAQRQATQDTLRELEVAYALCEREQCGARDQGRWLRATALREDARSEQGGQNHDRALTLAEQALEEIRALERIEAPTFRIPAEVSRITREGNRLALSPRIKFAVGGNDIVPESLASLDDLVKTLQANTDLLVSVRVVGYTDSSGSLRRNQEISLTRAKRVRDDLVRRGIDARLIQTEGRGPESPIANNDTAEGRELNRRVEIHIETRP